MSDASGLTEEIVRSENVEESVQRSLHIHKLNVLKKLRSFLTEISSKHEDTFQINYNASYLESTVCSIPFELYFVLHACYFLCLFVCLFDC